MEFPEPEALLEHRAFLQRLARGLVRDDQAADDAVQEAYVRALEKPPRPGNLRAWLARVTRNFALSERRGEKRRSRRERAAARGEGIPPLDVALSRLELQRRVVEAVLALEEPYRSAVVYRFFHDLTMAELGRQLHVPEATARTQVRRGLEILRGRLDGLHDGDRRAWALALLALAAPRPRRAFPGAVVAGAVAIAVLGVGGVLLVEAGRKEPPPRRTGAPAEPAAPAPAEPAATAPMQAEEPRGDESPPSVAGPARPWPEFEAAPESVPGFCLVPAGTLHPGCTRENYEQRAQRDDRLKKALVYDVWGQAGTLELPAYRIGRYEVTNAQWKHYLDAAGFRVEHVTDGTESLADLAERYDTSWESIFAFNHDALRGSLKFRDPAAPRRGILQRQLRARLKEGERLTFYRGSVPRHWYGWCELSGLLSSREYCDARKPADEAFIVPEDGTFAQTRSLRAKDFAAYPVRDVSAKEALAFAEWAGCHLPSEYEWERGGRGDRSNESQHPFEGEPTRDNVAWANNPAVYHGPLPVDDERVAEGDSGFGPRHLLGNVWELTRTFYDMHPFVVPRPPDDDRGLFNHALTAKGGSWGDGWFLMQLSARTGVLGSASLDLRFGNRADSLGLRLVRHEQPGEDLLRHSILRLAYDFDRGTWRRPLPHAFAIPRMAGVDEVHIEDAGSPYVHVRARAKGLAFAPVWCAPMVDGDVVGALRSDWSLWTKSGVLPAGEWLVVARDGRLGLVGESGGALAPAVAERRAGPGGPAELVRDGDHYVLRFSVEESGRQAPPGPRDSWLWALCDVRQHGKDWEGWPGRRPGTHSWHFEVILDRG